ncbi:alpha/beta hydrolase [Rhodococcus sp. IEGM 1379]|uniref:alpha/beta fold hydrolase n=1 Tax=Rhodococcus sp. IEGM 1379 TaxID=3047086 RepID=UPI0024B76990|nr:alpha/beta hydrolase [Rhodococcus sp. IEGM 1379]MDI9913770.1 alpha/beta hydrolase [Rhodococcus sp. IEGM 1379]
MRSFSSRSSDYGTTHVNVCGPRDGAPVILLPGGGATSAVWFGNVSALSAHNRVYAVDLIGDVGRSIARGKPVKTIDDLLDWLGTVVGGLGLDSPSLISHSYGAMIALAYAIRNPDAVNRLVLIDPNSCFTGMKPQYLLHALPILLRPNEKRERAFIEWETDGASLDEDWFSLLARGAASFPKSKTIVPKRPGKKALASLSVATTVILAGRSKVHDSRRVEGSIRVSIPHARTVILDSATHHTLPMQPAAELNAALSSVVGSQ